ncbi:M28 family peptidase [Aldersonia sp. NBC_00410]|uniref:M28 family peptidase n=1 Tax=Aldersonia sp. NBC_00410 TaxID=2975954 RepID=UPI002251B4A8|nr:M28 family peptidase [Aldersonia sp. NBC_00410]MCX5041946.1 M28 family peptidase [Aldersonia sp. NBC_00410]
MRVGSGGAESIRAGAVAGVLALLFALSGCSADQPEQGPAAVADAIEVDALATHLDNLQRAADDHDGNRAAGTPGYDASVDYVAGALRDRGFDVQTPEFDFGTYGVKAQGLTVGGRATDARVVEYSPATPAGGVTAPVLALPDGDGPGCEAADYDGRPATGAIVVVSRGVCPFVDKARIAADAGALAVVVANNEDGPAPAATLGTPDAGSIPIMVVDKNTGMDVAAATTPVTVLVDAESRRITTRNVVAQTRTGATDNVVMAGAHLDSVPEGPGINDNGTGTAAVLETALQLGPEPDVSNAVRFAFWGAEEEGLLGSAAYVRSLEPAQRLDIALYLNFDMLGSPNAGHFVYDGDDSEKSGEPGGPEGSAGIERTLSSSLLSRGVEPRPDDLDGRSDYGAFLAHGIPVGGTDTGAEGAKTEAEAQLWGGTAGQAYDPNYHTAGDTAANVDRDALAAHAAAVAFTIASYADSTEGPNGVPARADRERIRGGSA